MRSSAWTKVSISRALLIVSGSSQFPRATASENRASRSTGREICADQRMASGIATKSPRSARSPEAIQTARTARSAEAVEASPVRVA